MDNSVHKQANLFITSSTHQYHITIFRLEHATLSLCELEKWLCGIGVYYFINLTAHLILHIQIINHSPSPCFQPWTPKFVYNNLYIGDNSVQNSPKMGISIFTLRIVYAAIYIYIGHNKQFLPYISTKIGTIDKMGKIVYSICSSLQWRCVPQNFFVPESIPSSTSL